MDIVVAGSIYFQTKVRFKKYSWFRKQYFYYNVYSLLFNIMALCTKISTGKHWLHVTYILLLEQYSFLTLHSEHHFIQEKSLQIVFRNKEKNWAHNNYNICYFINPHINTFQYKSYNSKKIFWNTTLIFQCSAKTLFANLRLFRASSKKY